MPERGRATLDGDHVLDRQGQAVQRPWPGRRQASRVWHPAVNRSRAHGQALPRLAASHAHLPVRQAARLGFLDYQRATLEWKCRGLSDEQLRVALPPPATRATSSGSGAWPPGQRGPCVPEGGGTRSSARVRTGFRGARTAPAARQPRGTVV
ncbi:MAG TPA: DUF664 domain-containing protein [Streptosporangiaceae bacterium]